MRLPPLSDLLGRGRDHVLVRFVVLRLLGLVYLVAFLVAANQIVPLVGRHGLEPATVYFDRVRAHAGFWDAPSLFQFVAPTDGALLVVSWLGVALSALVLAGAENAILLVALWVLYFAIDSVGQTFWGFGWEAQLLETGFACAFLCPVRSIRPFAATPPMTGIWLLRWLIVRVMLGAGLIKLRGDPCWRDFTCLVYHYETQPNPSPMSWVFNAMPKWFHEVGVFVNHAVEVGAPLLVFGPRRARLFAGAAFVLFQVTLIVSGNLSFLNWLTIVPALACFDDRAIRWAWRRLLRRAFFRRLLRRATSVRRVLATVTARLAALPAAPSRAAAIAAWVYGAVVVWLSIPVVENLVSPNQSMNRSFDPFRLVNTYGAFGSVGRERDEIVIEGTSDEAPTADTVWKSYEFPCKPGDPNRRPCLVTPYHYRFDWQIWFAAMGQPGRQPWLIHFVQKALAGDRAIEPLIAKDPFPNEPPRWIRIQHYRYRFTRPGDGQPGWWTRELLGPWLPPTRKDNPAVLEMMRRRGWDD